MLYHPFRLRRLESHRFYLRVQFHPFLQFRQSYLLLHRLELLPIYLLIPQKLKSQVFVRQLINLPTFPQHLHTNRSLFHLLVDPHLRHRLLRRRFIVHILHQVFLPMYHRCEGLILPLRDPLLRIRRIPHLQYEQSPLQRQYRLGSQLLLTLQQHLPSGLLAPLHHKNQKSLRVRI